MQHLSREVRWNIVLAYAESCPVMRANGMAIHLICGEFLRLPGTSLVSKDRGTVTILKMLQ